MSYNYLSNYGKPPEPEAPEPLTDEARRRRWLRIAGVLVALGALGGMLWFFLFGPTPLELKARRFAVPDRQFVDQNLRVNMPDGWLMLRRDNPYFTNVVNGRMFAIHPRSGCTAALYIWPNRGEPLDYQIDSVKSGFSGWERISERDRQSVTINGQEARRVTYDLWKQKAIRQVAYVTMVRDDLRYYVLLGFTPLEGGEPAFSAFKNLEQGVYLDPVPTPPQETPQTPAAQ